MKRNSFLLCGIALSVAVCGIASNLSFAEIKQISRDGTVNLPPKYDLRNDGGKSYVTPIRNQFYDGGCRSFASMSALESHIKLKEGIDIDLSENNMETRNGFVHYSRGNKLGIREGRVRESDIPYLISGIGPILEIEDPYILYISLFKFFHI